MDLKSKDSALDLISTYSDDDFDIFEDELDNLPSKKSGQFVASSNKDADINTSSGTLKHQRLPVPLSIKLLYKESRSQEETPDNDPDLHGGRVRSFPHQRGNWSTFVFVPFTPEDEFLDMLSGMQSLAARVGLVLSPVTDFHISLTRTVVLLHHWINNFVTSVRAKLSSFLRFDLELGPPAVYCNDERTRTFLGLKVHTNASQLAEISLALDQCLAEFRLPPFYKDPSFHLSVLWVVGDHQKTLQALLPQLHVQWDVLHKECPHQLYTSVTQCLCKIGNKSFTFSLPSS